MLVPSPYSLRTHSTQYTVLLLPGRHFVFLLDDRRPEIDDLEFGICGLLSEKSLKMCRESGFGRGMKNDFFIFFLRNFSKG